MQTKTKVKITLLFLVLLAFISTLIVGLSSSQSTQAVLVNKPLPYFEQADLNASDQVVTNADILTEELQLLNVWASWCGVCKLEHELLKELASEGVHIIGLNYRDNRQAALSMLFKDGDPYKRIIYDPQGDLALDLGVIGTPETYLINRHGIILKKFSGAITRDIWNNEFLTFYKH